MKGDIAMSRNERAKTFLAAILVLQILPLGRVFANGGPFVVKYPNGDPAAKGVLARLDPDLKPAKETRLKVVKEDLKVTFGKDRRNDETLPPLVKVIAEYTIENPTDSEVEIDFGFPILRGVYVRPSGMMRIIPNSPVEVRLGNDEIRSTLISNSAIYAMIRRRARDAIEKAVAADEALAVLVMAVYDSNDEERELAQQILSQHLTDNMKWDKRDAALMAAYAALDLGEAKAHPLDRSPFQVTMDFELKDLINDNLGPLAAIGEQKATQFFARLVSRFDPQAGAAYESIFTAWGGDVRERSVDLLTGQVRPREVSVDVEKLSNARGRWTDPTIYARVDYLDPKARITEIERQSCKAILKNLPVIFTFAPMNLLHYQVKFAPKSTQTLTVSYRQYAYSDTRTPSSYQLAYVVHPASLWQEFGPINLEVTVPEGVRFRASDNAGIKAPVVKKESERGGPEVYTGTVRDKTGEIYLAVESESWKNGVKQVAMQHKVGR
jgi:hypothetical protein